jgi:hypothetical protein
VFTRIVGHRVAAFPCAWRRNADLLVSADHARDEMLLTNRSYSAISANRNKLFSVISGSTEMAEW